MQVPEITSATVVFPALRGTPFPRRRMGWPTAEYPLDESGSIVWDK